jgi:hypothetical protein
VTNLWRLERDSIPVSNCQCNQSILNTYNLQYFTLQKSVVAIKQLLVVFSETVFC